MAILQYTARGLFPISSLYLLDSLGLLTGSAEQCVPPGDAEAPAEPACTAQNAHDCFQGSSSCREMLLSCLDDM